MLRLMARLLGRRCRPSGRLGNVQKISPRLQELEPRLVLSGGDPSAHVAMLTAATADSKSVTIEYRLDSTPDDASPLSFGVFRSSDATFDPGDTPAGAWSASPNADGSALQDDDGRLASALGVHRLTIPLPEGLAPYPARPYVLVVADPSNPTATTDPGQTASFRKRVIGIVTHGALINPSWKYGPPWQLTMAKLLQWQDYDSVIPFNWTRESGKPGHAAGQGPRLARQILTKARQFPSSDPVDLHFISHSEGAVVNTVAIVRLEKTATPQIRAGFLEDTLLDPHAATTRFPGKDFSQTGGPVGWLAGGLLDAYNSRAKDPAVFIPASVDESHVFYQQNPAHRDRGVNAGMYNLWGQVPVPNQSGGPIHYYNLTAAGATHSGKYGVQIWYRNFVAPSLGMQAPLIRALQLDGRIEGADAGVATSAMPRGEARRVRVLGPQRVVHTGHPVFTGTAAPGARVRLLVGPASNPSTLIVAGQTKANPAGVWTLATRRLREGHYRAIATSFARALRTRPGLAVVPTTPLGRFTIRK